MLLRILLLQVVSMALITLPTKAQEPSDDEMPELFMTDTDKAFMSKIWTIAGYSNGGPNSEVERKFFGNIYNAAALPPGAVGMPGYMPMMPYPMMPAMPGMPAYHTGFAQQNVQNQQQKQIIQTGTKNTGSPTTINYRVQPKPPNSELDSSEEDESPEGDVDEPVSTSRRMLDPENTDWEISDEETDPRDLETEELPLERMERMMQFENTKATKGDTPSRTLKIRRPKNHRTSKNNSPTTLSQDVEQNATANRNSHMETLRNNNNERKRYMHKKKYYRKTANATSNAGKRKESNRKPDKSLETRKYYEMLENSQKYMCKCNMDEEKYRRKNEDLRHDQDANCTKYCSATEGKDTKTNDKPNGRLRSRPDKDREHPRERYHNAKRENEEEIGEGEAVRPKTTLSRRHRNKHRNLIAEWNKENIVNTYRGSTEGYFSSISTEAEEMVNNENDRMHLPDENQFARKAEYRSSIDPVEAYAEESDYRPMGNPMYRYPDGVEYHPEVDSMRRHADEPDYGAVEMDEIMPGMDVEYKSIGDTGLTTHDVDSSEYMAWSPVEVLHNVKDYNPIIDQYPYDPHMNNQFESYVQ